MLGRKSTFTLNPDKIPDLQWNLASSYHTTSIGLPIPGTDVISTHYIDINTLSYAKGDKHNLWCGVSLNNNVTTVQSNTRTVISVVLLYVPDTPPKQWGDRTLKTSDPHLPLYLFHHIPS